MNAPTDAKSADILLAQQWLNRLAEQAGGPAMGPAELPLPARWIDAAAILVALMLTEGKQVQIVVPDDDTLPELSNALDIDLRPLCLVLPEAEFATRIALRATLTLLKSRLHRHSDSHPVWEAQRQRIECLAGIWQEALQWGQSESETAWPAASARLFPARLLPASHAVAFGGYADVQVLIAPERMPAAWRDALTLPEAAAQVLCLSATTRGTERRQLVSFNTEQRQRYELDVLSREIAELELELATVQAEIADFSQRYHSIVGRRMVELDRLQAEIAERVAAQQPEDEELQQAAAHSHAQAERSQQEQQRFEEIPRQKDETKPFAPSRDLKKLYRQIAQKIHPDRAASESERDWRTHLMSEATRAYRHEDEAALREVLSLWQQGPDGSSKHVPNSNDQHNVLTSQLQKMKARLTGIQSELDRLLGSRLYELFVATRLAQRQNRDLLQEMATTVELQIAAATQRLQTLQTASSDPSPPEEVA